MSLKSLINGVAVATVAAGSLLTGPGVAEARDWQRSHGAGHGRDGGEYVNRWGDVRGGYHSDRGAWAHRRDEGRYYGHHDHTGRNVAIGAFAAILGLAIAAQSQRVQEEYYDERD